MNMDACNYNAEATVDDGSCEFAAEGCDCDGNCTVYGCMDPDATNFDENAAKSVKGVIAVLPIPHGISVVADSSWHAQKGLEALNVQFEGGKKHNLGTKSLDILFSSNLEKMGKGQIQGEKTLDLEYEIQFLSHLPKQYPILPVLFPYSLLEQSQ